MLATEHGLSGDHGRLNMPTVADPVQAHAVHAEDTQHQHQHSDQSPVVERPELGAVGNWLIAE
jgi:hypothetical protein